MYLHSVLDTLFCEQNGFLGSVYVPGYMSSCAGVDVSLPAYADDERAGTLTATWGGIPTPGRQRMILLQFCVRRRFVIPVATIVFSMHATTFACFARCLPHMLRALTLGVFVEGFRR